MKCSRLAVFALALLFCFLPGKTYADGKLTGKFTLIHTRVTDLAVEGSNYTGITIVWTSPSLSGNRGPWLRYDLRYSRSVIDSEERWQSATPVAGLPPQPPGYPERVTVIGLEPCTNYFFAIKAVDIEGRWTHLSNSPLGRTLCYTEGGGIGGLPATYTDYPLTLSVDMLGRVATVRVSIEGELASVLVAKDPADKHTFELDKGAKVVLADGRVPELLKFREASANLPSPEGMMIVGRIYEFGAYATALSQPSPVNIAPSARLLLSYDPAQVPENAVELSIAYYDATRGWQPLEPVPGAVAEVGKVHGMVNHFTPFAILARLAEPAPASFQVTRLVVEPTRVQRGSEVTVTVEVANTGGRSGEYRLVLKVDGEVREARTILLPPGGIEKVSFVLSGYAPGLHKVEVAGLMGEFEVVEEAEVTSKWWLVIAILLAVMLVVYLAVRRKAAR